MHDRLHLARTDGSPAERRYHHRGFGRHAVTQKCALLGLCEMHAHPLDGTDLCDAFRQLLFDGGRIAGLLHKLAGGHRCLVFQSIEHAATLVARQPLRGQQDPRLVKARQRHTQIAGRGIEARIEIRRLQILKRGLLITLHHARKNRPVRRFLHPPIDTAKQDQRQKNDDPGHRLAHRRLQKNILQRAGHTDRRRSTRRINDTQGVPHHRVTAADARRHGVLFGRNGKCACCTDSH